MTTAPPPICRNCGDSFAAPERPCPQPSPGCPYKECGRGGHMFETPPVLPLEPMTAERLREIKALCVRLDNPAPDESWTHLDDLDPKLLADMIRQARVALPDLLVEHDRLLAECKRLQRVGMESARVGGDPVFTRDQIERIFADEKPAAPEARGVKGRR